MSSKAPGSEKERDRRRALAAWRGEWETILDAIEAGPDAVS